MIPIGCDRSDKSRNYRSQIKELKIKLILYNISKIILTILVWTRAKEFYKTNCWGF